ncbi:MAG: DNA adenine methylase, partial [Firmicutes bacterium]|nr:DNA adenine methylase [Bacillota bacterium]
MIYQGGKRKIAKPIINILQQCIDKNKIKTYYEPFVGGANIIDKIKCERKIGNDNHKELIALLKAVQSGWKMPEYITEEEYNLVKNNQGLFTDNYVGLVGFCGSFAAKYFEGYNVYNDPQRTINGKRNPIMEAINELRNQDLSGIEFTNKNYLDVDTSQIKNWLVFCDPPNARSAKYAINKF